ncbi:tubulin polyglutamylase complex subunit 2-like [Tubulanus polymorphus]|uniref:tubulin polyglutamylase complex subunit 2-like n=1 Tax=Tubulanus polymorphus TaxID=672921 RepID=UPI003DA42591
MNMEEKTNISSGKKLSSTHERLLQEILTSLEKRHTVCDVMVSRHSPADQSELYSWEHRHNCVLPDDLKEFYRSMDGLLVKWSTKVIDSKIALGRMEVNGILHLGRIGATLNSINKDAPSIVDVDRDDATDLARPRFDARSRLFELDPCEGHGKVALCYKNTKAGVPSSNPEIWFLDRSFEWHFLAESFSKYYRLMLIHLGLPQWQYVYTDIGLSNQSKQWYNLYTPIQLEMDTHFNDSESVINSNTVHNNVLDVAKLFKGKGEKKKVTSATAGARKKPIQM